MFKKLRISLICSNLVVTKSLNSNRRMHNLYANFVRILGVCKRFSKDLVNDKGNMPRCGVVPRFSDLEAVALSLAEETMGYDSESYLSGQLEVPYRYNWKDWKPFHKPFAKALKRLETNFTQFTDQLNIMRNYAKDYMGFFTRIISKVSAFTVSQYINKINDKPIGRIKYAPA